MGVIHDHMRRSGFLGALLPTMRLKWKREGRMKWKLISGGILLVVSRKERNRKEHMEAVVCLWAIQGLPQGSFPPSPIVNPKPINPKS